MHKTDTTQSLAPDQVKDNWNFLEVWVDPMQSPPYILLLLSDKMNSWSVLDPAEGYGLVKVFPNYEEAENWLLEDEYEPLEGRLSSSEIDANI
ncbi:hypothetical protein H4N54_03930 [Limnospira fusiformis KN01]|uniref:hypothetical protein n=1 Tax=Limnospira TaxID=2596745 RepID=UPI00165887E4|nr:MULTISPECIES: hypothetical protein [Limnospira]MDT9199369.1 hypothetical protein [Limnospira sp. PMC 1042.18]ULB46526.1 hypothetical protein H4N54_03930 [Limnospira fusiformis KN01]